MITERQKEALDLYEKHGSQARAAEAMGISKRSFERLLARAREPFIDQKAEEDGFPLEGVKRYWKKTKEYSALIERSEHYRSPEDIANIIGAALKDYEPPKMTTFRPGSTEPLLAIYPIPDAHHGMKAWAPVAGADWDLKKSMKTYIDFTTALAKRTPPTETAWIVNLGDFFHQNDSFNVTPGHKHLLDIDSRYDHVIFTGTQLFKSIIDIVATNHRNVRVISLKGNHDPDSSVALNAAMYWAYKEHEFVDAPFHVNDFFFDTYGQYFFGANHGYKRKPAELAKMMYVDHPDLWGKTKYRHFIHGHFHHAMVSKEDGGVSVECFQTLTARDAHAATSAYRSGRSMTSLIIDPEKGEIARFKEPI